MVETMIEFSAAGLVVRAVHDRVLTPFAVRHPSMESGRPLQALSTGPKFGFNFPDFLMKRFGGDMENSNCSNHLWDARCRVPTDRIDEFIQWVCDQETRHPHDGWMFWDPYPELQRRLSQPYWQGVDPPLSEAEAEAVQLTPMRFVRQPPTGENKVRLFKLYQLVQPADLLDRMVRGDAGTDGVAIKLGIGHLRTTEGGSQQGTFRDLVLSDNLGLCVAHQEWPI